MISNHYWDHYIDLKIIVCGQKVNTKTLNLHYLKPTVRAAFLDELMKTAPQKITDKSRIRARYKLLAGSRKYKEFKPCFKHYLTEHVKSKIVRVPMSEWEVAIFLPTEQFKKKGKAAIWNDSMKIARKS